VQNKLAGKVIAAEFIYLKFNHPAKKQGEQTTHKSRLLPYLRGWLGFYGALPSWTESQSLYL